MTALSSNTHFDMDFLQPEDTMDLASSPHMRPDDLDLDLDAMHEQPLDTEDKMIDDPPDPSEYKTEHIHPEMFDDDEMVDEDTIIHINPDQVSDLIMNGNRHEEQLFEDKDEDILYEDEELQKDTAFLKDPQDVVQDGEEKQEPAGGTLENPQYDEVADNRNTAIISDDGTAKDAVGGNTPTADISATSEAAPLKEVRHTGEAEPEHLSAVPDSNQIISTEPEQPFTTEDQSDVETDPNTGHNGLDLATNTNDSVFSASLPEIDHLDTTTTQQNSNFGEAVHDQLEDSPTQDVVIHPVKVIYQDSEISLFPPQHNEEGETFFLSETSLAHESLDKLLASCRDVLADTIGDDDELVLDVASMGLHISEGSKYAAEITLTQILDVYLTLSHNDNIEQIEPLYFNLSSRVCLASQYAYLTTAAQEGKKFTEISAEHLGMSEDNTFEQQGELVSYSDEDASDQKDLDQAAFNETGHLVPDGLTLTHETELETQQTADGYTEKYVEHTEESHNLETYYSEKLPAGDGELGEEQEGDRQDEKVEKQNAALQTTSVEAEDGVEVLTETGQDPTNTLEEPGNSSAATETASSHTVEADHLAKEESFEEQDETLEGGVDFDPDKDHETLETHDNSGQGEEQQDHYLEPSDQANGSHHDSSLEQDEEDDLLDFEPEDHDPQPTEDVSLAENQVDEGVVEDDAPEDLFAEDDTSTDQTVGGKSSEKTNGHLNAAVFPSTPSKGTRSKRKVADEDDEFGLLDTETPEKKRRRPS